MEKRTKFLIIFICVVFLVNSCAFPVVVDETTETNSSTVGTSAPNPMTNTPIPTETSTPTITPTPTATAYVHQRRRLLTVDMVKNIDTSHEISMDENGNILGLPVNIEPNKRENIVEFYKILAEKFIGSQIYYDEDPISGQFVLIVVLGGTIFHRLIVDSEGNKELYDFPTTFEITEDGYELVGEYSSVSFPGKNYSVGVVWDNGIPQLVSNRLTFPNGDSYFTHYLVYTEPYSYTGMFWKEILGIADVLEDLPSIENDLNPRYVQTMSYEYRGVVINAELITDDSVASPPSVFINKVIISEPIYAEYIARTFFNVWWKKGEQVHTQEPTQKDFNDFMSLWSTAQKSGLQEDWAKVQINNIWANDLSDGNGYTQEPYSIWMMYDGETPQGVRGFNKFSIVFVGGDGDKYVYRMHLGTYQAGYGTNLDKMVFMVYAYREFLFSSYHSGHAGIFSFNLGRVSNFLLLNNISSNNIGLVPKDIDLYNLLKSGLVVQ